MSADALPSYNFGFDQEKTRKLLESSLENFNIIEKNGTIRQVSAPFLQSLGYLPQDVAGKNLFDCVNVEDIPSIQAAIKRAMAEPGIVVSAQFQVQDAKDNWVHLETLASYDPQLEVIKCFCQDITARIEAEQQQQLELRLSQTGQELTKCLELNQLLETLVRTAGELIGTNAGFVCLLTTTETENIAPIVIGFPKKYKYLPSKPGDGIIWRVWQEDQPLFFQEHLELNPTSASKESTSRPSLIAVPLKSSSQKIGVLGLAQFKEDKTFDNQQLEILSRFADTATTALENALQFKALRHELDEQKKVETRLRNRKRLMSSLHFGNSQEVVAATRTEAALRESEERFRLLVDGVKDYAIYLLDSKGQIVSWNVGAERIKGYTSQEVIGQHFSIFYTKEDIARGVPEQTLTIAGIEGRFEDEGWRLRMDGTRFWTNSVTAALRDETGQLQGFYRVSRDLTERRRNEDALLEQKLKASKLESLGLLAGGIAHDFNNILTTVTTNLSIMNISADFPADYREYLVEAEQAALHARHLTQQLLTFAKGGAPVRETTDLHTIVQESTKFVLSGSRAQAEFDLPPDLWAVEVDKGQLSQVLQNLVLNALQAMNGTGTVKLIARNVILSSQEIIGLPAPAKYVQILVQDNGVGISPENLPKIFDPYFTTKPNGNGLGLATCYSIIKRHDGYIMVESTLGQGTIFQIYLPASRAKVTLSPAKETAPLIGRGRVLLMDDEPGVRKAIGTALSRLGYHVVLTSEGSEAVERYHESLIAGEPFEAVLMDLTVRGGMGGMEATQKILELDPQAKVIIASGYSEDLVMSQYQEYGFAGMVSKPFKISELSQILVKVIQGEEQVENRQSKQ